MTQPVDVIDDQLPRPVRNRSDECHGGELHGAVELAFGAAGPLARHDPAYAGRTVQIEMAHGVADAIADRTVLVAEAGTGVGKTFAYLVPTLLSGGRALISTATKSLQDQLYARDIPRLLRALAIAPKVALLKGRGSYLCLHRLDHARQSLQPFDPAVHTLGHVERWAQATRSGDLAEIDGLDERSPVVGLVTSTRENCLGSECPRYRECHVVLARREAMAADVTVINHHLFFADLLLRETGVAELLPSADIAVFDEAHQLADIGVQFLGTVLGSAALIDFARDLLTGGLQHARGLAPWIELSGACERAARQLRLAAAGGRAVGGTRLRWREREVLPGFVQALGAIGSATEAAAAGLRNLAGVAPDLDRLCERAERLAALALQFSAPAADRRVRWIDVSAHQIRLVESPLDIRDSLRLQIEASPKTWIFTSATLGDDAGLSWFTEAAGLVGSPTLQLGSPFDYATSARLYVPRGFPKPADAAHSPAVARLAARCAKAAGGRTFVLTTTLRALRLIAEVLRGELRASGEDIEVLVQAEMPKRELLQQFLSHPRAILVGSQSFWEGIDVAGDRLQCVVIDKLPFPPPSDPLVEAMVQRLESEGRNAFADYFVAETAVSLKQGAGRLIRSESDRGLLVVCDSRLVGASYARRLLAALPPMPPVESEAEALAWLASLTEAPPY